MREVRWKQSHVWKRAMHPHHIRLPRGRWRIFTFGFDNRPHIGGVHRRECGSLRFWQSPAYPQAASHSMQPAPPLSDFANVSAMLVRDMTAPLMPYTRIFPLSSPSPVQQASYFFVDNPNILLARALSANQSQLGSRKDPYEGYLKISL